MNAILVSVDYADILAITLPLNRHHFDKVLVVTSLSDLETVTVAAKYSNVQVHQTDIFYQGGAEFNKGAALEQGLDELGRNGWMCIMDADVIWPTILPHCIRYWEPGNLYVPYRRMLFEIEGLTLQTVPRNWSRFPRHPGPEFAGYSQIFHADDPVLGQRPWYETNWKHAGGCDSVFQAKWPESHKIRPEWEVLHLGEGGKNWTGRSTPYLNGKRHPQATARAARVREYVRGRVPGLNRFDNEKLLPFVPPPASP